MFRRRLTWVSGDFGTLTAKDEPYEYVVWGRKDESELRIIRKELVAPGALVPMQDFSVFTRDIQSAMRLGEQVNRLIRKSRRYNGPISL